MIAILFFKKYPTKIAAQATIFFLKNINKIADRSAILRLNGVKIKSLL